MQTPMMNSARNYDRTSYILVVDDDNTLLKFFKIHLNKFFSKVIVVKNAKEAIDSLKEKEIDLLITDINMPRMDGLQLLKKVRKHNACVPVLFISGALLTDEKLDEINTLADGFLRKPFTVEQLHQFISSGMELREKMLSFSGMLKSKQIKLFRQILAGETDISSFFKTQEEINRANSILGEIRTILSKTRNHQS